MDIDIIDDFDDGQIRLASTQIEDLSYIVELEHHKQNSRFLLLWQQSKHEDALKDPDIVHLTAFLSRPTKTWTKIGFVIIKGFDQNGSVELSRIVIDKKGKGYGTKIIQLIQKWVFDTLNRHRIWLDVFDFNTRAQKVYQRLGLRKEGKLRDVVMDESGQYQSLIIMSILEDEYYQTSSSDSIPEWNFPERNITITTDRTVIPLQQVFDFLHNRAYWCKHIPYDIMSSSIENSVPFTVLQENEFIGFARLVTDHTTFAYLADVFVLEQYRGQGIGQLLVSSVNQWIEDHGIRTSLLLTKDAQGLYHKFDWIVYPDPSNIMRYKKPTPDFYNST